eukprot:g8632.t1
MSTLKTQLAEFCRVAWPASLQRLSLGDFFDQAITGVLWPDWLQQLSSGNGFNHQDTRANSTDSLTTAEFPRPPRGLLQSYMRVFSERIPLLVARARAFTRRAVGRCFLSCGQGGYPPDQNTNNTSSARADDMAADSSEVVPAGIRHASREQAYHRPEGPEARNGTSRRTQDNPGQQGDDRTTEEDTIMPSRNVDEGSSFAGLPRRKVSSSPRSEASASDTRRTTRSASELPASYPPATTPVVDAPRSPSAPSERTEEEQPMQAQAILPGPPNPDQAMASSTSTCSVLPSTTPSGGSIPAQWLGYWAGGGDITDLSQGHNYTTVHAALTYYAGVDLLGIL